MAESVAREKFACPSCGADAHWNPQRHALVCSYCGTVAPGEYGSGDVRELDLVTALRQIPEEKRGWKAEKRSVKCQSCQAISVVDPERVAQRCEFCGSAQIIPYDQIKAPVSPESLLPLKVPETVVREDLRRWYGSRWFAPSRLKTDAATDQIKGIYLPYWTFDAQAQAHWSADSGYYYYTSETYRDAQGNTRTRRVRHVRWQASSGSLNHFFDDELVPATKGVDMTLLRKVEPFPTKELVPFSAGFIAGWVVEQYQIDLVGAAQHARQQMESTLHGLCAKQVPGDTYRNLSVRSQFGQQTFKHILLPVWLVSYVYGGRTFQVIVNGYTGTIAGKHPLSPWKIAALIFVLLIAALLFLLFNR
ncbi:MAG: zinc ribbon domain-containing protein [Verrucomicrobiota bacterium]|nr:zinc ribbon domain-containing protein [Verrucomicrobiota bacterium]